jgi:predicted dehydrogenase
MKPSIKIIGAGSIGNHLSNAFRVRNCNVTLCDRDSEALKRSKETIYPARYGAWDDEIQLKLLNQTYKDRFDVVVIGTPPESHISLALKEIVSTKPKILLIEKPLSTNSNAGLEELKKVSSKEKTEVLVGYNHKLVKAIKFAEEILTNEDLGEIKTIRSMTREHWKGIFSAHPWIDGPNDSYLGQITKGGGALQEHSHALNLFLHFVKFLNLGKVREVSAFQKIVKKQNLHYDEISHLSLRTTKGFVGLVEQDVITYPEQKLIRIEGSKGFVEVCIGKECDTIKYLSNNKKIKLKSISKKRAHDFLTEIDHIIARISNAEDRSPLCLSDAIETHKVIQAAFLSVNLKKVITL